MAFEIAPRSYAALGLPLPGTRMNSTPSAPRTAQPSRSKSQSRTNSYYEALRESEDRTSLPVYPRGYRTLVQSLDRERITWLADYLYDNCGAVSYTVDTIANYSVPIIPQAATDDPDVNKAYDDAWAEWAKVADFTGRFHLDMLQRLCCKALDIAADIGVGLTLQSGIPQLQFVEGWRINNRHGLNGNIDPRHCDGVVKDQLARVIGYLVEMPDNRSEFVSANEMFLLFDPDRISSYRGVSPIRRGSNDIRDANDIKGFEKMAVKLGSALPAIIESEGPLEEDVWGNDSGNSGTGGTDPGNQLPSDATEQERKVSLWELLGGDIPVLPRGQSMKLLAHLRTGDGLMEFVNYLGGSFVMGLGIPPAFFLDEKLTGPNQRGVNGKAQRKFDQRQCAIATMIEWLWPRVIGWHIQAGIVPLHKQFRKMSWNGPAKVSIDAGRESQQEREDVANGLMTYQNHYANRALESRREIPQWLAERRQIVKAAKEAADSDDVPITFYLPASFVAFGAASQQPANEQNSNDSEDNAKQDNTKGKHGSASRQPPVKEDKKK